MLNHWEDREDNREMRSALRQVLWVAQCMLLAAVCGLGTIAFLLAITRALVWMFGFAQPGMELMLTGACR